MKALISPNQNNFVVQVEPDDNTFEIGLPLYWADCPDDIVAYQYQYIDSQYVEYVPPPTPAETNKATAVGLLQATDWTQIPSVSDPSLSNPYLSNKLAFDQYRNDVRQYAVYPVEGNITWPTIPEENWVKV
jgi:hypothetical protein